MPNALMSPRTAVLCVEVAVRQVVPLFRRPRLRARHLCVDAMLIGTRESLPAAVCRGGTLPWAHWPPRVHSATVRIQAPMGNRQAAVFRGLIPPRGRRPHRGLPVSVRVFHLSTMRLCPSLRLVAPRLGRLVRGLACQLPPVTTHTMMLNQLKVITLQTMEETCCPFQLAPRPPSHCGRSQ